MQAPLRDRDPRRLGSYRLLGRLGRGGMGTVFLGESGTGERVAVKVINPELADDEAFHERFRREVTAARQVSRFCTAAVLDARLEGDPLYIVTEYVPGSSLEQAVKDGGPLRGGDLESFAVNVATALRAIHGAGIVHRDLKPSNVLLSPTGPRVIDFGIARALDASDGPTRTGQFVGTPAYMAPELMRGEEVTPAADVFSWGCVVAYAATGRAPFGGGTLPETINRVMTADPDLTGLEPPVRDLVARALAKDPADRPTVPRLLRSLTGEENPPTIALPTPGPPPGPSPGPPPDPLPGPAEQVPPTRPAGALPAAQGRSARRNHGLAAAAVAAAVAVPAVFGALQLAGDDGDTAGQGAAASAHALGDGPPDSKDEVFDDDFDDEDSGWPRTGEAAYADDRYRLRLAASLPHATAPAPVRSVPQAQLIDVRVRPGGPDAEAGVFCRGREGGGFAFLVRGNGQARIVKMTTMAQQELYTGFVSGFRGDRFNRLQATCTPDAPGVRLGMWVNGEALTSTTEGTEEPEASGPGESGLIVSRAGDPSREQHATFDDFALCRV